MLVSLSSDQWVGVLVAVAVVLVSSFKFFRPPRCCSRRPRAGPTPSLHIVLDLDETLIHRVDDPGHGRSADLNIQTKYFDRVIFRRFLMEPGEEGRWVFFTFRSRAAFFFRTFSQAGASFGIRSWNSQDLVEEVVKIVNHCVPGVKFHQPACQRRKKIHRGLQCSRW